MSPCVSGRTSLGHPQALTGTEQSPCSRQMAERGFKRSAHKNIPETGCRPPYPHSYNERAFELAALLHLSQIIREGEGRGVDPGTAGGRPRSNPA